MKGTFEELRAAHPGRWLLIRAGGPEDDTGVLLFADEDGDRVSRETNRAPNGAQDMERPLYITYSEPELPEGETLTAYVL